MRIVHLNPFFFPYAGGTERRILELGRRLAKRHEVTVVTSRLPGTAADETVDGIRVVRLPSRFRLKRFWNPPLVSTTGVEETLRGLAPDVIDFHYRWSPSYHRAFQAASAFSARCFTYQNTYGEGTGLLRWASLANDRRTRGFIQEADRIIAVSAFIRDDLTKRGFPSEKIVVVPNGIDPAALETEAARGTLPRELEGHRYIAAVGRLVPIKGYAMAVRSMAKLPPDLHLAICGRGPDRRRLVRIAQRNGVRDRVHVLGWVPEADKLALLQRAEAFVHPARFEAFGIAPLEAMALGIPVAAARVGGLPELVDGGGRLFEVDQAAGYEAAVQQLVSDPSTKREAGAAARARADQFTWDRAAEQAEATYAAAVSARQTT